MNESHEFIEQHDVMVVLPDEKEPVPAVATVTWDVPTTRDYFILPA